MRRMVLIILGTNRSRHMAKFMLTTAIKDRHPIEDWRADVRDGFTTDSYLTWVKHEIANREEEDDD
jgi:hypothetical protein